MRATESGKVWKALSKSYAPGKYHLYYILTFHLRNIYADFGTSFEIQPNRKPRRNVRWRLFGTVN